MGRVKKYNNVKIKTREIFLVSSQTQAHQAVLGPPL